jgi:hypothetical protein
MTDEKEKNFTNFYYFYYRDLFNYNWFKKKFYTPNQIYENLKRSKKIWDGLTKFTKIPYVWKFLYPLIPKRSKIFLQQLADWRQRNKQGKREKKLLSSNRKTFLNSKLTREKS